MALDGIVINKILSEIKEDLPLKINQIYGLSSQEIIMRLRTFNKNKTLLVSTHPNNNRIQYTKIKYDNFSHPNNFIMLLRKHLNNGVITEIMQQEMDRYFILTVESYDDIGDLQVYYLHIELMGRYANLILTKENNIIIDAIKRISPIDNPERPMVPGAIYYPPDPQNKSNIYTVQEISNPENLVRDFSGVSPLLAKEFQYRMNKGISSEEIIMDLSSSHSLWVTQIKDSYEYHVIELLHLQGTSQSFSLTDGFDYVYHQKTMQQRVKDITNDLESIVKRDLKRLRRRITNLEDSLIKADQAESYRIKGDLILTYQSEIKKGMSYVNLIDYNNIEHTIPLEKTLGPIENAQKYFKKYKKLKNSVYHLNQQIRIAQDDLIYLESVEQQLAIADINAALEIRDDLENKGVIKKQTPVTKKKKTPNYQSVEVDGCKIIFGKNSLQNDYITFKIAKNNHTWLHAQGYHGAHVVILSDQVKPKVLEVAAMIAAYYSQARHSPSVLVDYTLVKNIKRVPNSKAGQVLLTEHNTLNIKIDEKVLNKYLAK